MVAKRVILEALEMQSPVQALAPEEAAHLFG
jgi:hypothetical protein